MKILPAPTYRCHLDTRLAAAHLCISEWKLRRLIRTRTAAPMHEGEGPPFLPDIRNLDEFVERNIRVGTGEKIRLKSSKEFPI